MTQTPIEDPEQRLKLIKIWHSPDTTWITRRTRCAECLTTWPCDTRRIADGTYVDSDTDEEHPRDDQ